MRLTGLLDVLSASSLYRDLLGRLQENVSVDDVSIIRAARPFVLAALARDWPGPVLYVTGRVDRAYNVSEQLPVWVGERPVYRFAEPTALFYERSPWGDNVIRSRIMTLAALMPPGDTRAGAPLIVTSARAIMQRTLPVNQFRKNSMILKAGQRHPLDRLLASWVKIGYEPAPIVTLPGQFSRRGGVVDIYPMHAELPARIEFFDDEIDSLRQFDPSTQRSTAKIDQLPITPAREALPEHGGQAAAHLRQWFGSLPPAEKDVTSPQPDAESLSHGTVFPYIEHYLPYLYPNPVSLLDYVPQDGLIVIEDWAELRDKIAEIEENALQTRHERQAANQLAPDHPLPYITWDALAEEIEGRAVLHLGFSPHLRSSASDGEEIEETGNWRLFAPERHFGGQLRPVIEHLRDLRKKGDRAVVVTPQAARLTELWREQETFQPTVKNVEQQPGRGSVLFIDGALQEGWHLAAVDGDVHLLTDAEIFGWRRPEPRRRKTGQSKQARVPETTYADLNEGDFVVHVDYGIGRFAGMRRRTIESNEREYLLVEYAGTDLLFVPIHQADRLTRYVGPDERPPTINRLGKPDWIKIKAQAQKAVEDEARELLEIYAERASSSGHAFAPDTPWQHELEASFPFVETEDQLRAVREVKTDMELSQPMDRLICGDVGYGKTEVALRAAFKAVMDGKQVAVLVPTTILAQQHYETFSRRLAPFPVKVEMLSRFRGKEEQREILPKLTSGDIDIIIGTHRLLGEDVKLKDLGLVIIDEEQRFGVTHKEHFKKLRAMVDVLTLTATPIPRTLYMGLAGVRDISMIMTPPEERLPVITHVGPFDDRMVRQAVLRELERGGQVFFVHNRVQTIEAVQERLERIVPEARTIIGHGQMDERYLEKVMFRFGHGDYDILVSTAIIESGLDIPNANTLIVDRADYFGMAQLYQLRGRVGRSAQQAYAYFFHPGDARLTEEARARLETLAENTQLGSGFQIAMRDLELRGAGDILSTKQTGHVAAIGLHLYTQLLTQTIKHLKGEDAEQPAPAATTANITIDLPLPAYIPTSWVPEMSLRLQVYRRIANLATQPEVEAMRAELRDRFGPLPQAVESLLYQIDVKLLAQQAGATAVISPNGHIQVKLPYLPDIDRAALNRQLGRDVEVTRTAVEIPLEPDSWQNRLLDVLGQLAEAMKAGIGM